MGVAHLLMILFRVHRTCIQMRLYKEVIVKT